HLGMAANDGEEVVEVVRGTGGHAPDIGKRLCVPEVRLETPQSAQITQPPHEAEWAPGSVVFRPGPHDTPADRPVSPHPPVLVVHRPVGGGRGGEQCRVYTSPVIRMDVV